MKKVGRPLGSKNKVSNDKLLSIRLTEKDLNKLKLKANSVSLSVSELIRKWIQE
jgi:predicted DNA binding CopG/RHH family protein